MSDCAPLTYKQTYRVKTRGGGGLCLFTQRICLNSHKIFHVNILNFYFILSYYSSMHPQEGAVGYISLLLYVSYFSTCGLNGQGM
jgi:hypothetical protein